jgi:hypothetical protein
MRNTVVLVVLAVCLEPPPTVQAVRYMVLVAVAQMAWWGA